MPAPKRNLIEIVRDTREQKAHHQHDGIECYYSDHGLVHGDYALLEDCTETKSETGVVHNRWLNKYGIERKSIADFISSWFIGKNANRERNKLIAARSDGCGFCYVLDGDDEDIFNYPYNKRFPSGRVQFKAVLKKIAELRYYGFPVYTYPNRNYAELGIICLLKRRAEDLKRNNKKRKKSNG